MHLLNTLLEMHTYARPHGSKTEQVFIDRYIRPLGAERDRHGNWHVVVGDAPVLWSCHTDTVHRQHGRQDLRLNGHILTLAKGSKSSCLGSDDTAGVFICTEMIKRNVPGHYVFHMGEEVGGLGSRALAREQPKWLSNMRFAIALDRKGGGDVITHQMGGRTASDAFAVSLAEGLGLGYAPCDLGIYTDTAEYAEIIPECSNLSIGYEKAHSSLESLDTLHTLDLLNALTRLDANTLVAMRDPLEYFEPYKEEYLESCMFCGTDYNVGESTSNEPYYYCSEDCEDGIVLTKDELEYFRSSRPRNVVSHSLAHTMPLWSDYEWK